MAKNERKIRVLIGKVGFDPHDRGILVLSQGLRNAGMEVIFLGKFQTAEEVVTAAIQENVEVMSRARSRERGGRVLLKATPRRSRGSPMRWLTGFVLGSFVAAACATPPATLDHILTGGWACNTREDLLEQLCGARFLP